MKKLLLSLFFVFAALTAHAQPRPTQDDFHACYEKNKGSIVSVNKHFGVAITKDLIAVPKNGDAPIVKYVKFDPFLQLYLVRSDAPLAAPVMADGADDERVSKSTWVAVLSDDNASKMGHVKALGENLGDFDTLSFEYNATGELNTPCCKLLGIAVGRDKFVPSRYLKHFAAYEDVYYGDIGVKFTQKEGKFYVSEVDPLGRGKMLIKGDELIGIAGALPTSLRQINEAILFAPKGSKIEIIVQRNGTQTIFNVPVSGDLKFTQSADALVPNSSSQPNLNAMPSTVASDMDEQILRDYGIAVDNKLIVTKVESGSQAEKFGIKFNDRIVEVERERVKTRSELLNKIADKQSFTLVFSRKDFQFFVKVSPK